MNTHYLLKILIIQLDKNNHGVYKNFPKLARVQTYDFDVKSSFSRAIRGSKRAEIKDSSEIFIELRQW